MAKRKIMPRRQVLAIITDMRQVTDAIRRSWDRPTAGRLPDGSHGRLPDAQLPGGVIADWVQIREASSFLHKLASQLDETAANEIMRIRRGES